MGRTFDFLYPPTQRGLSTKLSSLLLHTSVPKHGLNEATQAQDKLRLGVKYKRQVLNDNEHL
jgi:hypothetical protein